MSSTDELATGQQAEQLLYEISALTRVRGAATGMAYIWSSDTEVVLPEAIRERAGLTAEESRGYYVAASYNPEISSGGLPHGAVDLSKGDTHKHDRLEDLIRYQVKRTEGDSVIERLFRGENPVIRQLEFEDRSARLVEAFETDDLDFADFLQKEVNDRAEQRQKAEITAGQLGLTLVFADEARALVELITSL